MRSQEAYSRLVAILLVTMSNVRMSEDWAHRASVHLQHALRVLDMIHQRLQIQRVRQSHQLHNRRGYQNLYRSEQQRLQRLNHTAPLLEPDCRLNVPSKKSLREQVPLLFQLEMAFARLFESAAVLMQLF